MEAGVVEGVVMEEVGAVFVEVVAVEGGVWVDAVEVALVELGVVVKEEVGVAVKGVVEGVEVAKLTCLSPMEVGAVEGVGLEEVGVTMKGEVEGVEVGLGMVMEVGKLKTACVPIQ
jgi:hypothetical protein